MKVLYYYKIKEYINDKEYINRFKNHCHTQLRYGEPKQIKPLIINSFDAFLTSNIDTPAVYVEHTVFSNKPYLRCPISFWDDKKIYKRQFRSYRQEKELCIVNSCDYTFKELMETLPSEEFVDWCLDNKLNSEVNV